VEVAATASEIVLRDSKNARTATLLFTKEGVDRIHRRRQAGRVRLGLKLTMTLPPQGCGKIARC
jgi:Flp pilus assembly protein CpaB